MSLCNNTSYTYEDLIFINTHYLGEASKRHD